MSAGVTQTGRCHCGAVRYRFSGPPRWSCYCHCSDCRRITASPVTAYFGVALDRFDWTGTAPQTYKSSARATRRFCGTCGTQLAFSHEIFPDEIHLLTATLDAPEALPPAFHVFTVDQLPWFETTDELPRHHKFLHQTPGAEDPAVKP
ncbi:GFA family protein [Oceanomicrobium pacificus]|uniref:GFA family protein n=1 Tax=Oceanomicrobium pacificus TaxID=2692916 RepID=A0A6B0TQW6_9RHOB|nr:GFA family protein [Oceanomicrobium pacificus]MXU64148.1 GFA family protein [Oceanomicrobium pacificus]